jgi:hypothetical protein
MEPHSRAMIKINDMATGRLRKFFTSGMEPTYEQEFTVYTKFSSTFYC